MRRRRIILGFVFLLGVLTHIESLGYWFTAADTLALIETSRITSLADVWTILTKPLMYGTSYLHIGLFYRPVVNFTFAFDYWLWGLNPFGYHLTNILLHGLAAALVVVTSRSLTTSTRVGVLTGVLFAVHPLSVDTVPAISRRQDILMAIFGLLTLWLFVKALRREESHSQRLRIGATVAYALALLSKETAIVLGPLVFLWALLQKSSLRHPRAYRQAVRDVLPFVGVAVVYLAVRFLVLGGIGGYSRSPSLSTMLLMPVRYVLALVYPAHTFGALADVSVLLFLAITIGIPVAYLLLLRRKRSLRELDRTRLVVVAIVGFVTVTAMVLFPSAVRSVLVKNPHVGWYAVGLVFAIAATSAIVAVLSSARTFAAGNHRLDAFLLVWLVIPVPLFLVGKEFKFRSAYFFVIPLLTLLVTYLMKVVTLFEEDRVSLSAGADAAFALAVLVLLVPSLAASPLLYANSGWDTAGDITQQTLTGVENDVTGINGTTRVVIEDVPYQVQYHPKHLGEARERTMLHPFSVRSWLRLHGHEGSVTVRRTRFFRTAPHTVSTPTNREDGTLIIHVQYTWRQTPTAYDGVLYSAYDTVRNLPQVHGLSQRVSYCFAPNPR
jgi:hypothetical protein